MFSLESATALGEGYLCDGVVVAIVKGPWRIDDDDRAQIEHGIEYLNSAAEYHERMWNFDSHSLERIRHYQDVSRAIHSLQYREKLPQDPVETLETRLARYTAALYRLRDGFVIPADTMQNLPELDDLFGEIGQVLSVRASDIRQRSFSDCTISLL